MEDTIIIHSFLPNVFIETLLLPDTVLGSEAIEMNRKNIFLLDKEQIYR